MRRIGNFPGSELGNFPGSEPGNFPIPLLDLGRPLASVLLTFNKKFTFFRDRFHHAVIRTSDRSITGHAPLLTELLGLAYKHCITWAFIYVMHVYFRQGVGGGWHDVGAVHK